MKVLECRNRDCGEKLLLRLGNEGNRPIGQDRDSQHIGSATDGAVLCVDLFRASRGVEENFVHFTTRRTPVFRMLIPIEGFHAEKKYTKKNPQVYSVL